MPDDLTKVPQNSTARTIQVDSSNGSTITRANIKALSLADYTAFDNKEVRMEQVIERLTEARYAGAMESSMHDLLMSNTVPLKMQTLSEDGSVIAPFSMVPRRHNVNVNFFKVEGGTEAALAVQAGSNDLFQGSGWTNLKMSDSATTGAGVAIPSDGTDETMGWVLTVSLGGEVGSGLAKTNFNKGSITNLGSYFLPGDYVCIETNGENIKNASSATTAAYKNTTPYTFVMKVIGAYSYVDGGVEKAKVVVVPRQNQSTYAAFSTNLQKETEAGKPTAGGLVCLNNSVSDYESYKEQNPSINNKEMLVYWWQTSRTFSQYNDEYLKALNAGLTTSYWKDFKQLPLTEQKRQQFKIEEKKYFNTIFYGDAIDTTSQTTNTYQNLPTVVDPLDSAMTLEYKSNTIGIFNQLSAAGRIHNASYGALNLDTLFEILYQLKRNREAGGGTVDVIDCFTDRKTASRIFQAMTAFYKAYYQSDIVGLFKANEKIVFEGKFMWQYNLYDIPESNVQLAVFVEPYFNDRIDAFNFGVGSGDSKYSLPRRASSLWFLDWSDIEIGLGKTRKVQRKTNDLDDQFNYIIQPNMRHVFLESKTYQVRVYDANRHAIIHNFTDETPIVSTLHGTVLL